MKKFELNAGSVSAARLSPKLNGARLRNRLSAAVRNIGIRGRVFLYFLLFTAALLILLWVFQIALLSNFYKLQKTQMLTASVDTIASNIDNESLQLLSDRVARTNDVSVLIINERAEKLISSDRLREGVLNRMNERDLQRYISLANTEQSTIYRIFTLGGQETSEYDEKRFNGHVPPANNTRTQSMVAIREVFTQDGEARYIFVNAEITPVDATVQTLRSQYLFIAILMVLLSFVISLVLSRRIAQPIVNANEAAKGLAQGRYIPDGKRVSYREIEQLNATLTQAAKDLRRVEGMQRELIANISHDLRTPLTLIEGYAEAMRDLPGENTPDNMQVIIEETKRLTSLVNAILEYSADQNGQIIIRPTAFDLTQSIQRILTRYQKLTEQDGYTITFDHAQNVTVKADEIKIGQVIYNLINNALTYTGQDKTVKVTQFIRGDRVRIEITDTGDGIDQQELPYIWSRYYRGQKPHKRATVGTGLGLSIVKGILDAHNLPHGVQSPPGQGATFWFELPTED